MEKTRNVMKLLKAMKTHSGFGKCTYIEIVMYEIQMSKDLMIYDIFQGSEVIIPPQLLVKNLPLSYRFYDSILRIILE